MGGRSGTTENKTKSITGGGMEKITYEEKANGVTVIRTRFKKKKGRKRTKVTKGKK